MHINFSNEKGKLYAKIVGEIDHHSAVEIKDSVDSKVICEGISTLVFDLTELAFMDSSGIGAIIGRYKLMKSLGGQMYIISSNKSVDKLLTLSGITEIISVVSEAEEIEKLA